MPSADKTAADRSPPVPPSSRLTGRILARLRRAYGPRPWKRWGDGVSVLVGTILSQNTSNANSEAGYRQLRRKFRSWNQVAAAPVGEVERCIRVSGLSNLKAPRIQAILRQIKTDRGRIDLQFLDDLGERDAFDYLRRFAGVGPKTAYCVLMFAFGKPVFPVDTHIHRIARRLGWIGPKVSAEQAHDRLTPAIEPADRYEMHVLLIAHGRQTCRAVNPRCDDCVLLALCEYGRTRASCSVRAPSSGAGAAGSVYRPGTKATKALLARPSPPDRSLAILR